MPTHVSAVAPVEVGSAMLLASRYRYNAGMGITSLLITAAVSVFFTPFLISRFGTERYGLWALGFSIVQFAVVLDAGLLAATRRFQAQASAAGDLKQVNAVLGVSLALYAPIGAVALVFVASGAYWVPLIVEVPPALSAEFRVFMVALGAFIGLQFLRSAFTGLLFGANRVDLERFVKVAQRLTIVAMTAAFVVAWQSTLRSAALGIVFGSIVSLGLAWILVRVVVPGSRPNLSGGVELALAMARFSSGVLLITIGAALLAYLPPLAIGGTLGPSAIAVFAVASLMVGYIAQAMQAISAPIFPVAARYGHERERAELAVLYVRTTRIVLLISISCSVAVAVYAPDILTHWVGAEFEPAGRLVAILLLGAIFVHAAMPARHILIATRRVLGLGVIQLSFGVATLLSIVAVLDYTSLRLSGVAWTLAVSNAVLAGLVVPGYATRQLGLPPVRTWFASYLRLLAYGIAFATTAAFARHLLAPSNLGGAVAATGATALAGLLAGAFVAISRSERRSILRLLNPSHPGARETSSS